MTKVVRRCAWAESDPLLLAYHDEEWGVPEYDSRALWEKLMLDGFQAGLSWSIILRKRAAFRKAFKNFNPEKVARFGEADVARLLEDAGIVRSRAKIEATIGGARRADGRFRIAVTCPPKLLYPRSSPRLSRNGDSNSSARLSCTRGCRPSESLTITRRIAFGGGRSGSCPARPYTCT
jgi:hypothetical protein